MSGADQPYAMGSNPHYTGVPSAPVPDGGVIGADGGGYPAAIPDRLPKPQPVPPPPDTSNWSDKPNSAWNHRASRGVEVHRDKLRDVARALEGDLNELQTALEQISTKCNVGRAQLGDWDAALQLGTTLENAYTAFGAYYNDLVRGYRAVIQRLHKSAAIYADAEDAAEAGVRNLGSPPSRPTIYNTGSSWT